MTNKEFTKDKFFRKCCDRMDIIPTTRQASKFRRNMGLAIKVAPRIRTEMKLNEKGK